MMLSFVNIVFLSILSVNLLTCPVHWGTVHGHVSKLTDKIDESTTLANDNIIQVLQISL